MFICPELGPQPARAGYNGTAKPMERAALDAAYAARSPAERGFFDADEARAHAKARKEWIEAQRERLNLLASQGAKALVVDSCHVIKALYPVVENVGGIVQSTGPELAGHLSDTVEKEQLRGGVVPKGKGGAEKPHLSEQGKTQLQGAHAGWDAVGLDHHSSPSVDACSDASSSSGGCE